MRNGYFIITEVGAMKKRIIHLSKSTVSVILTLCMLVSCVTVGLIATDAAQLTDSQAVGANAESESVGATEVTVYFTPGGYSGANYYRVNYCWRYKDGTEYWNYAPASDTGETIIGNSVFSATFSLTYDGARTMQFQGYGDSEYTQWNWR